jgi:hypothetical protein
MVLIFLIEISNCAIVLLQEKFQKIIDSFSHKNCSITKKLFLFFIYVFQKEFFKMKFEYLVKIFSKDFRKILIFKIKTAFFLVLIDREKNFGFKINLDFILNLIEIKNSKEIDFKLSFDLFSNINKNFGNNEYLIQKITCWFRLFNEEQKLRKLIFSLSFFIYNEKNLKNFVYCTKQFFNKIKDESIFDEFLKIFFNFSNQTLLKRFLSFYKQKKYLV